jgi:glycine hydroxymethyltransferase
MFTTSLQNKDSLVFNAISQELSRQQDYIELIASENIVSKAVLEAQGSVLTNKYAEGYPAKRYYGGCEHVDIIEAEAIERLKKLFTCNFANVQPHSGATANQIVFFAFLQPGDTIMGLDLACGGHLTHGAKMTMSGKWFNSISYGLDKDGYIDYESVEKLAIENKPKLIVAGTSSYPRIIDWKRFREIADKVGAILMIDMAHVAGLVAGGVYPSPLPFADVVTSTTHKTLRGPRGGIILWNDEKYTKQINSACFPGMIGGPLMHVIAAKCVSFGEALEPAFKEYAKSVVSNAKIFAAELIEAGYDITTKGTDCHLLVLDLQKTGLTGKEMELILHEAGLTCNKNAVPNDPKSPFVTSGLRLGTSAGTTRGFGNAEFKQIAKWISDLIKAKITNNDELLASTQKQIKQDVKTLCGKFPIYR